MSLWEIIMLICFGAAWPFSIHKSYTSKSTKGKSLTFLIILILGYLAGIFHKIFYNYDFIIFLYITNMIMVIIDTLLFIKNSKISKTQ